MTRYDEVNKHTQKVLDAMNEGKIQTTDVSLNIIAQALLDINQSLAIIVDIENERRVTNETDKQRIER